MSNPTNEELNVATWKIPNALGIIGSSANNKFNGMTASWITQVSMDPLLIAVGIDNKSVTHGLMSASEYFSLNLFSEKPNGRKPLKRKSLICSLGGWILKELIILVANLIQLNASPEIK